MKKSLCSSLTGDPSDPLFHLVAETLGVSGSDARHVYAVLFEEACEHITHIFEHYGAFWARVVLGDGELSVPGQSLYHVVLPKLGVSLEKISQRTADNMARLLVFTVNKTVAEIVNFNFCFLIGELRKHHPHLA